jgi:TRAP-type mannitol/chloroaromatic compound transport system permease small subunit
MGKINIEQWFINSAHSIINNERSHKFINDSWFYKGKVYEKNDTAEFWKWLFKSVIPSCVHSLELEGIDEMIEAGYIVKKESSSWKNKQLNQTCWYELTIKGIRYLVKKYSLTYEQ